MARKSKRTDLIQLLRHRSDLTAEAIATHIGMHKNSIYRLVNSCIEDGYFIIHENGKFRLSNEDRERSLFDVSLTWQQAHDLVTAVEGIHTLTPHAQSAIEEVSLYLKNANLASPSAVYHHSYDQIDANIYSAVARGITQRHALELTYQPAQKDRPASQHTFDPFKIIFWNGHYYLVGRSRKYVHKPSGGIMHLRLDRIVSAVVAMEKDSKPPKKLTFAAPDFDPQAYVEKFFGTFGGQADPEVMTLRFQPDNAKAAASVYKHTSRELSWEEDGSLLYTLTVPITDEVVWWIASWNGVEVLEPAHLRKRVYEHCLEIAKRNA